MPESKLYTRCSACEFVGLGHLTWGYVGLLDLFVNVASDSELIKIIRDHHRKYPIDGAYCHGKHYLFTQFELANLEPRLVTNFSGFPERVYRNHIGALFVAKTGDIAQMTLRRFARKLF